MKSVKILALALGLMMLVSAAGFAQTSMTTTFANIPIAPNAQTGLVGEIDFVPLVTGTIPAGESITVTYGATISSYSDLQVFVLGCNLNQALVLGTAADCTAAPNPAGGTFPVGSVTASINAASNAIVLAFGNGSEVTSGGRVGTSVATQFVRITGVRVNANALTPAVGAVINATVTNSVGLGTITNNFVPVATVSEPIAIAGSGPISCSQVGCTSIKGTVTISELFANAFETKGATNPTQLILTVTPPTGFTFTPTGNYTSNAQLTTNVSAGVIARVAFATANTIQINIEGQNSQLLDSIEVPVFFSAAAPVPLTPGPATVTGTLAPPLTTVTPVTVSATVANSPLRYAVRNASANITFSVGNKLTLLYSVFNVWSTTFNTGFAVANPTGNLAAANTAFFNAAQPGTVKVWLVPADGSAVKTLTTSADVKPGIGLDATGQIPAGGEWTVLLSDLATAAGFTSFQGQVFFQTNFSDAHGVNFIADPTFGVSSQGYPMLVIQSNTTDYRANTPGSFSN